MEIAAPGTVYRGCRFDWSGFVTQVTLDGRHTFCAPESLEPGHGTGGAGLCSEFSTSRPLGFDETRPGDWFPKLGVGLLQRPDAGPYRFGREYPLEPYPLAVNVSKDAVEFQFEPVACQGYAARLTKTVRVSGTKLRMESELRNLGTQRIRTNEYNHNFLALDGLGPGPELELQLSPGLRLARVSGHLVQQGTTVRWPEAPAKPHMAYSRERLRYRAEGAAWELRHRPSGVGVRETVDFEISHLGLWFAPHALSPEVFVEIDVKPGEGMAWAREWEFFSEWWVESDK